MSFIAHSGHTFARSVWRRQVLDMFLDAQFFHMPSRAAIADWLTIVDNMVANDKVQLSYSVSLVTWCTVVQTTFKEVLSRLATSQMPTLNLLSSRDAEYEIRASALKKLAFVLLRCICVALLHHDRMWHFYSSPIDQYQPLLSDVLERLTDTQRLYTQSALVQTQVLLCFRVLLVRLSPQHLTPLWPPIATELVRAIAAYVLQFTILSLITGIATVDARAGGNRRQ